VATDANLKGLTKLVIHSRGYNLVVTEKAYYTSLYLDTCANLKGPTATS
jgi:hypothetical protein